MYSPESSEYERLKHNLKLYNGHLNQCIRAATNEFYHNEFSKYKNKNDIRNTWNTFKEIINKTTFKSDFPSCFVHEGVDIIGAKSIADIQRVFCWNRTQVSQINQPTNKNPSNLYLTASCAASFNFSHTNSDVIEKNIRNLTPKSSAGFDNISTKYRLQKLNMPYRVQWAS